MKKIILLFVLGFFELSAFSQKTAGDTTHNNPTGGGCESQFVVIFQHPVSYSACSGSTVLFITNFWNFTEQAEKVWQESIDGGVNWLDIPGTYVYYPFGFSGNDTLVLAGVTPSMSGNKYRVHFQCQIISNAAALTVVAPPSIITSQPTDVSACVGSNAVFNINVSGGSLSYQWQQSTDGGTSFTNISGPNTSQLQLNAVTQSMNGYKYRCVVTSECSPTLTSAIAVLNVSSDNTVVSTQPSAQQACGINSSATFTVAASGQPVAYQWQRQKYNSNLYTDIPGANSASSVLTGLNNNNDQDNVRCKITRSCGSLIYSNGAVLRVYIDPVISQQPVNAQSCVGSTATFKIWVDSIVKNGALFAQWEQSVDGGITFTNATGTNSYNTDYTGHYTSYTFTFSVSSAAMNNYKYRCRLYNPCFTKYSDTASLLLNIPPVIVSQPINKVACQYDLVSFSVGATGSITSYQWQVSTDGGNNYSNISLSNTNLLYLPSVDPTLNNNLYRCQVNSSCTAPILSNAALLNVTALSNMVDDTCKSISCLTCSTDISAIYNTGQYPGAIWTPPDPVNATFGVYKLNVTNSGNCTDVALISVYNNTNNEIRVCPNGKTSITSNITGSTYQWQRRASANGTWFNLDYTGSINASGINTPVVTLPWQLFFYGYGYQFRCMVDGTNPSDITTIKSTDFWTGAIDSNWFNPNNWSCGVVPDQYKTDAFIYGGKPHYPEINSIIVVRSLMLFPGATIIVNAGGKIILTGN